MTFMDTTDMYMTQFHAVLPQIPSSGLLLFVFPRRFNTHSERKVMVIYIIMCANRILLWTVGCTSFAHGLGWCGGCGVGL